MNKSLSSSAKIFSVQSRGSLLSYQSLKFIAAIVDAGVIFSASVIGFAVYQSYLGGRIAITDESIGIGATVGLLFVLISSSTRLYGMEVVVNPARYVPSMIFSLAVALLCLASFMFLMKVGAEYSRGAIITLGVFAAVFIVTSRFILAWLAATGMRNGIVRGRRAITVGEASELERLSPHDLRRFGIEEIARIGVIQNERGKGLGEVGRARIADTIDLARHLRASEFVLMIPWDWDRLLAEVGDLLRPSPLAVRLLPDSKVRAVLAVQRHRSLDLAYAVELQREPLSQWERVVKRMVDLTFSLAAIVLLAPILLIAALAIKLDSRGPLLFRQRRVGFDNREFVIFKFRSMTTLDDGEDIPQARRDDHRVTRVGKVLRRTSVDELPQLFNVIRGDMSFGRA